MHVTATSKLMEGCSRRHVLQSSIASLDGSLMALNRTLAWEVLHAFCLMEISLLLETESFSTREFSKLHAKYSVVACMDMHVKTEL